MQVSKWVIKNKKHFSFKINCSQTLLWILKFFKYSTEYFVPLYIILLQHRDSDGENIDLRFSILTATVVTASAEHNPYAVALTTFPNAPEPRVLPSNKHKKQTLTFHSCSKNENSRCTFALLHILSYQSAVSAWGTPIWSHMAAGWGQYIYDCFHGQSRWPSTESGTLVSVKVWRGEKKWRQISFSLFVVFDCIAHILLQRCTLVVSPSLDFPPDDPTADAWATSQGVWLIWEQ